MGGKALDGRRVTKEEAIEIYMSLLVALEHSYDDILLCGSARREKETCGDLDIVIIPKENTTTLNDWLVNNFGYKKNGKPQTVGLIDGVQVEFYFATKKNFGSQILHFTGSPQSNIRLRRLAKKQNLTLSQHGIRNQNGFYISQDYSEEQIYSFFDLDYVEPKDR